MSRMGMTFTVSPYVWNDLNGVWIWVKGDQLVGRERYRVTVHRDGLGNVWADVAGPCGGVRLQTRPPDTMDTEFANGAPA